MRVILADRALSNGYSLGLATGLRESGAEVWVGGPARTTDASITSIYPRSGVPGQRLGKAVDGVVGQARFLRLVATVQPSLLHIQWPTAVDAEWALVAKRLYRLPLAYTVHNPTARVRGPEPHEGLQRRLIASADLVLTHGPLMREQVVNRHPRAARKVHAVEFGNYEHVVTRYPRHAARAELNLPLVGPVFAFVGQLRPRKGIDVLIDAFAEYHRQGGAGHLVIAGAATVPAYERQLREAAQTCESVVHWHVSPQLAPQHTLDLVISAATQVVLPFQDASQSGTVILAMTYGRCVVSTAVGEVDRTLGDRGLLIQPGDRQGLVQALHLAESDPGLCDRLGERARHHALTALSWSAIGARTHELYRGIVG